MMKKLIKKITAMILAGVMAANMGAAAFAEGKAADNVSNISNFDGLIEELTSLNAELAAMESRNSNGEYSEDIESKKREISIMENRLIAQGADTFNDEMMCEVITNADYSGAVTTRSTPNLSNLAAQLNQMYDAYGKQSTYYDGNKNYKIYEIYVTYSSSKKNGVPLQQVTTSHALYGSIRPLSTDAFQWIEEIVEVYLSKAASSVLEKHIPGISLIPYETWFSSKPDTSQISSPGNALVLTINSVTTIKFTYVLDEETDTWKLCLSTNLVKAAFTCTACMSKNGTPQNRSVDYPATSIYGGYTSSVPSAVTVFKNMQINSYISSGNLGINSLACLTKYKGRIVQTIPNPSSPLGL